MTAPLSLREMINEAITAGLGISEIVQEPSGAIRLLTIDKAKPPMLDELEAARARKNADRSRRDSSRN